MNVPLVTPSDLVQDFVRKYNETATALQQTPFYVLSKDIDLRALNNYTLIEPGDYSKIFIPTPPLIILADTNAPYPVNDAPIISLGEGPSANNICASFTLNQDANQAKEIPLIRAGYILDLTDGLNLQVQRRSRSETAFCHILLSYLIIE